MLESGTNIASVKKKWVFPGAWIDMLGFEEVVFKAGLIKGDDETCERGQEKIEWSTPQSSILKIWVCVCYLKDLGDDLTVLANMLVMSRVASFEA